MRPAAADWTEATKTKEGPSVETQQKGLSLGKVAEYCGVTRKTILRWAKEGLMPSFVLPSGHHRVQPKDVAVFLRQHGMPVPDGLGEDDRPSVLVVDDDEDVRRLVCRILRDDYNTREAWNGIEACLQLGHEPPDLLLLDIRMPKMDGIDVCREVRKDPRLKKMRILVVSAHLSDEVGAQLEGSVDGIVSKPFSPEELKAACDEAMGNPRSAAGADASSK
jgi:CheY-like chemotaxis protein